MTQWWWWWYWYWGWHIIYYMLHTIAAHVHMFQSTSPIFISNTQMYIEPCLIFVSIVLLLLLLLFHIFFALVFASCLFVYSNEYDTYLYVLCVLEGTWLNGKILLLSDQSMCNVLCHGVPYRKRIFIYTYLYVNVISFFIFALCLRLNK